MTSNIEDLLKSRILVIDGAMGTMIQTYKLTEGEYRGHKFKNHDKRQKGNYDLLNLSQPTIIAQIHREYLDVGVDIIKTNTFNATRISMEKYGMQEYVYEINLEAAKIARRVANEYSSRNLSKPRFVAGSVGPTHKTCSINPKSKTSMFNNLEYDAFRVSYEEQIEALINGGVDLILFETIVDTLTVKAGLFAAQNIFNKLQKELPIMLSITHSDKSGHTLSGQSIEAFLTSVSHTNLLSIGFNCSLGASKMETHLHRLKKSTSLYVSAYPSAGLPNHFGDYEETPQRMSKQMQQFVDDGIVNIIGGCCGTTPAHIAALVEIAKNAVPPTPTISHPYLHLSGLEDFAFSPKSKFVCVGEVDNASYVHVFHPHIKEGNSHEILKIVQQQLVNGAQRVEINVDDELLDGAKEITRVLCLIAADSNLAKAPIMISSSKWETIEAGLQSLQGKSIVNSISLKNGEKRFLQQAKQIKKYGAAVITMAFDENGVANSYQRRIEICEKAYNLLIQNGFARQEIILDPIIPIIEVGKSSQKDSAENFIESVKWIKENCRGAKTCGRIRNLTSLFKENNQKCRTIHSVFLHHAIKAGLDMTILNTSQYISYKNIPDHIKQQVTELIFKKQKN